jgi:hypothetical protein
MTELNWYSTVPSFTDFHQLTQDEHFYRVPPTWSLIVTDIVDSTRAIDSGRYKDVNTIGAACVVAAQNAMNRMQFPYVFGGDGATLIVPDSHLVQVRTALHSLANLSRTNFDLTLRIGDVRVDELERMGCVLEVAKFQLVGKQTIALFRGGALAKAEALIKSRSKSNDLSTTQTVLDDKSNLDGLSCRWQPIPSLHGRMVTLMVSAISEDTNQTYKYVLMQLDEILGGSMQSAIPLHAQNMRYKGFIELLKDEWRYAIRRASRNFLNRFLEIILAVLIFKWRVPIRSLNPRAYESKLGAHSDFRKFDEILRMVLDVTPQQLAQITTMLKNLHQSGKIRFGMHESDSALMTCFVYGLNDGEHIHFVDGADGGYALAARQMKSQSKKPS